MSTEDNKVEEKITEEVPVETQEESSEEQKKIYPEKDYSEVTCYNFLEVNEDATHEEIVSQYALLKKKNDPINKPELIKEYQNIELSGKIISEEPLRKYFDEHDKSTSIVYLILQKLFPIKVNNTKLYLHISLASIAISLVMFLLFLFFYGANKVHAMENKAEVIFSPIFVIDGLYTLYIILRVIKSFLNKEKVPKEKDDKKKNQKSEPVSNNNIIADGLAFIKFVLFVLFQINLMNYVKDSKSISVKLIFQPYLLIEVLEFVKNITKAINIRKALLNKEEPNVPELKNDTLLRYLIGKAKSSTSSKKNDKKEANVCKTCKCTVSESGCACVYVLIMFAKTFLFQILRVSQALLFIYIFGRKSSVSLAGFFIPILISPFLFSGYLIWRNKAGYKEIITEWIVDICKVIFLVFLVIDTFFYIIHTSIHVISFISILLPIFAEVIFTSVIIAAIIPYLIHIEENMKEHEE